MTDAELEQMLVRARMPVHHSAHREADENLARHARQDIPKLVAELRRLRGQAFALGVPKKKRGKR